MEKLKSVISHGHRKDDAAKDNPNPPTTPQSTRTTTGGLTGEGSHLASANKALKDSTSPGKESENIHPIYDQFTGNKSAMSGEPIQTTDHAPHFSNTTDMKQPASNASASPSTAQSATSSLRPNTLQGGSAAHDEGASTASIKSGVIGFPQGEHDTHAALGNRSPEAQKVGGNQILEGDSTSRTTAEQKGESHLGRDAAIGAGAAGAGGLAAHELNNKPEDASYNTPRPTEDTTLKQSKHDSPTVTDTDRSFPLAGGVTTRRPAEKTLTSEREPGTKEKEAGVHDGQGREALAGAAAAAAASSAHPSSERQRENNPPPTEARSGEKYHPEALAAATAAASTAQSSRSAGQEHGHDHIFRGDPCEPDPNASTTGSSGGLLFTSGPHATDTANRIDPKLHMPGSFPTPTPADEHSAPSYLESKGTTAIAPGAPGGQHELRHTGTLDEAKRSTEEPEVPTKEHHYGRDAAVVGGLGAAGAGAYAAGKHHQKEPTDIGNETFPAEQSPYSAKKLDPRVDAKPTGSPEQRFDPTSEKHHGRDAALTGGALGATGAAVHETAKPHKEVTTEQTQHSTPEKAEKAEKTHDHSTRDAALIGAGAATTAGLYANQRAAQPDSGPASSTIGPHKSNVANIVDPRVQPDPTVQKHHWAAPTVEDPAPSTVGPHESDIANIVDPRVRPDPEKQKAHMTTGPHKSDTLNRADPRVPHKSPQDDQHHYGRDAAVAGTAGATGYGAYEAAKMYDEHRGTQPGASLDEQRYDPSAPGAHDPAVNSKQPIAHQTQQPQHHYGRDAAAFGGVGAAGAGAYAATRGHEHQQPPTTQGQYPPAQASQQHQQTQQTQQTQHHYGRDAAVVGGVGAAGAGTYAATRGHEHQSAPATQEQYSPAQASQQHQQTQQTQQTQHHYGRDAAVVGGVGAAGAGTYAATRGHEHQQPPTTQGQYPPTQVNQPSATSQPHEDPAAATHQRYDSAQDPNKQHQKRDAALAAGAVAGAGGAYAYSQRDTEKEQRAAQKAHEQQIKDQQKDFEKRQKEQEKAFHDQQKDLEKKQASEQKHHNKLVAAEDKKHQKEVEKEQKQHEKEAEKAEKQHQKEAEKEEEGKEKKHHLFGFLHRDKKDKDKARSEENSPRQSRDSPRHSKELAGAGAVAGGAAAYEAAHDSDSDGKKGRNRLHKDPPKGHPAREAMEHSQHEDQTLGGKHQHIGIDGPIGDPNLVSGDHQTEKGVYGAHSIDDQHNTSLPTNTEQYSDGHGGTDAFHQQQAPQGQAAHGQRAPDWEAIRKADTPY